MVDIAPLVGAEATDAEIVEYYDLSRATFVVDRPDTPPPSYEVIAARMRAGSPMGRQLHWTARQDGRLVGVAIVILPDANNSDLSITEVRVLPELRRRGIGTAVLKGLVPELRGYGRELVTCQGLTAGAAGEAFATALGARRADEFVLQDLIVTGSDPAAWQVRMPAGYRLEQWVDRAPSALLDSYAHARDAIHDAPLGDSAYRPPEWTAEHVREIEARTLTRGVHRRVVVAVHDGGEVAGFTEVEVQPDAPDLVIQLDTAVLSEHRGHGLGHAVKAAMMRWLLTDNPDLVRVVTNTGADNVHMIRVNHQLGYIDTRLVVDVEIPLADLEAKLNG